MELYVLGIRHHGPGSSKSVLSALKDLKPDCILVEWPADAEKPISWIGDEGLKPPTALMIYEKKAIDQAAYLPFASFSPEWQACLWGNQHQIPVIPMDLPMGIQMVKQQWPDSGTEKTPGSTIVNDPLGFVAKLAGYNDGERWWEKHFEHRDNPTTIFKSIENLMVQLRMENQLSKALEQETLVREAHMRKILRSAIKSGYQNIIVVCGAWHVPAIVQWNQFTQKQDNQLLKGLKKVATEASWVPWSYDRLSVQAGYGAGVKAPAWYDLLFKHRDSVVARWMIKVAKAFRRAGFDASPAHIVQATQLAIALASIRQLSLPGIDEMEEAVVSVFCQGKREKFQLIREKLLVGNKVGQVDHKIGQLPILKDLEQHIKKTRLSKIWNTTEKVQKDLDLRKPTQKLASELIHRLLILGIPFGKERRGSQYKTGSFSEHWTLQRRTDYAFKLIKASMWGNTIQAAAEGAIKESLRKENDLTVLTDHLERSLKGNIPAVLPELTAVLGQLAATTQDVEQLMKGLPKLVAAYKYGNLLQIDMEEIFKVLLKYIPRVSSGLVYVVIDLDDQVLKTRFQQIRDVHQSILTLNEKTQLGLWLQSLERILDNVSAHPLIKGWVTRTLVDMGKISRSERADLFGFALSKPQEDLFKAFWLEGFLFGSSSILLFDHELWQLLDQWIESIEPDRFQELLPILRRTFSSFGAKDRYKLMTMVRNGIVENTAEPTLTTTLSEDDEAVLQGVKKLFGLNER